MVTEQRYARTETSAAVLWGNAGLALLKGSAGLLFGSSALLADAFRSAADAARSYYKPEAGQASVRPPGPAGSTGRTESTANVVIAMLLIIVGLEIGVSAIQEISRGIEQAPHWWTLIVTLLAFGLKAFFFSSTDKRMDILTTSVVFAGAGAAWLGGIWGKPLLLSFDPAAAIILSVLILLSGFRLIAGSNHKRTYPSMQEENPAELSEAAERIEGVIAVEHLRAWEQGHYVAVDLTICVNPRITVLEGQEIAKRVKEHLRKRFVHVTDISVHVDPYDPGYPYKSNHDPNQEQIPTLLQ